MVNQRIPERGLLVDLASLYPAFTSIEEVDLVPAILNQRNVV